MKNLCLLGATGSIGEQTIDIVRKNSDKYNLVAVAANRSVDKIINIIDEFKPNYVAMWNEEAYEEILKYVKNKNIDVTVLKGMEGLITISTLKEVELVITALVGMIGLEPTLAAIDANKDIALANKETLVVAGELVMRKAKEKGIKILPVDSEHGAVFQCLQGNKHKAVNKLILTASGGPFRGKTKEDLEKVTLKDALNHPNWSMGPKITVDSSTLMNKGLEVIEAHWLFDCDYNNIEVVVHPQSIIHSMVQYKDNSIIAQLSTPDMRLPIQYALNYGERLDAVIEELDLCKISTLTFEKPDLETFQCLKFAYEAGNKGKLMPAILNSSNEASVDLFLKNRILYKQIPEIIKECLDKFDYNKEVTLSNIIEIDKEIREYIYSKYNN